MRYTEIDLQCEDLLWFGIDINGYIFACTSGGTGCVPEFVCKSREETELLADYFMNELPHTTRGNLLIPVNDSPLVQDSLLLSAKGIFCFDAAIEDGRPDEYKKIAWPEVPLRLSALPNNIREILASHAINANIADCTFIQIPHAY